MYQFKSLGAQTNILMDSFLADITEKEDYFVIRTPQRPNYFWGNYILMKSIPNRGDFKRWVHIFDTEIGKRSETGFCAITFDLEREDRFDASEFLENGFRLEFDKVLTANKVIEPNKLNLELEIREYDLLKNIEGYIAVHFDHNWPYGNKAEQTEFLREQAFDFSKLVEQKMAKRFGGFLNGKLISDLGIYWNEEVVRFNSISTHACFRRIGACRTLVFSVSQDLLKLYPNKTLVMLADEDYHAAKIYESIGFEAKDRVIALEWKDDLKFGS